MIMKYQPTPFDKVFFGGFVVICVAMLVHLLLRYSGHPGHQMIAFGLWLVVAFMLVALVHGNIVRGIHRLEVKVPAKLALLSFTVAITSILAGMYKSGFF